MSPAILNWRYIQQLLWRPASGTGRAVRFLAYFNCFQAIFNLQDGFCVPLNLKQQVTNRLVLIRGENSCDWLQLLRD